MANRRNSDEDLFLEPSTRMADYIGKPKEACSIQKKNFRANINDMIKSRDASGTRPPERLRLSGVIYRYEFEP